MSETTTDIIINFITDVIVTLLISYLTMFSWNVLVPAVWHGAPHLSFMQGFALQYLQSGFTPRSSVRK